MMPQYVPSGKERPPFVRFDYLEYGVDAEASEKAGRPIPKVVPFVFITMPGGKDTFEAVASEWIAGKRKAAVEGTYNPDWAQRWQLMFDEWLKGNEVPRDGSPVKFCAQLTKEQITRLTAMGIPTLEDLASIPDSNLGALGLDGRNLRDLAKHILSGDGANAKKIADLEQQARDKEATIQSMAARLAVLEAADQKRETLTAKR